MIMKGLKFVHCADAFGPSVILVFGYLMHRKMWEIVINEYVHDRKLVCHPGRGYMIALQIGVTCLAVLCRNIQ